MPYADQDQGREVAWVQKGNAIGRVWGPSSEVRSD